MDDEMTPASRAMAKAMLMRSGFAEQTASWMAASAPSMERLREVIGEERNRPDTYAKTKGPSPAARAIDVAHKRLRAAMGTPWEAECKAHLEAVVARIKAEQERA